MKCPKCHFENTDTARFCSNCATPLPSQKELPVTKTLKGYGMNKDDTTRLSFGSEGLDGL